MSKHSEPVEIDEDEKPDSETLVVLDCVEQLVVLDERELELDRDVGVVFSVCEVLVLELDRLCDDDDDSEVADVVWLDDEEPDVVDVLRVDDEEPEVADVGLLDEVLKLLVEELDVLDGVLLVLDVVVLNVLGVLELLEVEDTDEDEDEDDEKSPLDELLVDDVDEELDEVVDIEVVEVDSVLLDSDCDDTDDVLDVLELELDGVRLDSVVEEEKEEDVLDVLVLDVLLESDPDDPELSDVLDASAKAKPLLLPLLTFVRSVASTLCVTATMSRTSRWRTVKALSIVSVRCVPPELERRITTFVPSPSMANPSSVRSTEIVIRILPTAAFARRSMRIAPIIVTPPLVGDKTSTTPASRDESCELRLEAVTFGVRLLKRRIPLFWKSVHSVQPSRTSRMPPGAMTSVASVLDNPINVATATLSLSVMVMAPLLLSKRATSSTPGTDAPPAPPLEALQTLLSVNDPDATAYLIAIRRPSPPCPPADTCR